MGHLFSSIRCSEDSSRIVVALVATLLVFAPLVQGGNLPLPLLVLELGSLVLLARVALHPALLGRVSAWVLVALMLGLSLPLLYLIPVPLEIWGELPGRAYYLELIRFADGDATVPGFRQASLVPFDTEWGWYALLFPTAIFLTTLGISERHLRLLITVIVVVAMFQALLGLVQFGQGPHSALRFGNPHYPQSAVGTYVNRSHLVALLYMVLPMVLALLAGTQGHTTPDPRRRTGRGLRAELAAGGGASIGMALLYAALAVVILLGIVFTRSRAGIALGLLGLLVSALVFAPRLKGRTPLGIVAVIVGIGLLLASMVGLAPVVARFASPDTIDNGRWEIFATAIDAARAFLPIGSGPSTFPGVYPRFQPADMTGFINRVHNDYLELLFDGGVLLLIPAALLLCLFLLRWKQVLSATKASRHRMIQLAAGIGATLMLLHSLLDFNLHIPANMGFFAFFAAVFFRWLPSQRQVSPPARRSPGNKLKTLEKRAKPKPITSPDRPIPDENLVNPFLDG